MDFTYNETQAAIREKVLSFAREHLNHDVAERDLEHRFDRHLWKQCAEIQLQSLCTSSEYGGSGMDALTTAIAYEALGEGCEDGGLPFSLAAHLFACAVPIDLHGTDSMKAAMLPSMARGEMIAANAMTEKDTGSDIKSVTTTATPKGNGFILHGEKSFVTNAPVADVFITYAKTSESKGFCGGLSAFVLTPEKHKFSISPAIRKLGVRTCPMARITFEDTYVDAEDMLGKLGGGAMIFSQSMEWERICLGSIHVGAMQRMLDRAIAYAKRRKSNGVPIGQYQAVSHKIAEMHVQLEAARLMIYKAASSLGGRQSMQLDASVTKLHVSETFRNFAATLFQIFGGAAYLEDSDASRLLRDAMGSTIYSGTSEIQKNIISKWLGL